MNKRDFILKPEQGPFTPILASGSLSHVARATDFQDEHAGNTMTSEEPVSDVIQFLRVCAAWNKERREKERRERQGSRQRSHCAAPEVLRLGPSPTPQLAASATPRTPFVESNPSTHTPL